MIKLKEKYMNAFSNFNLEMNWNEETKDFDLKYNGFTLSEFEILIKKAKKDIFDNSALIFPKNTCEKLINSFESKLSTKDSFARDFGVYEDKEEQSYVPALYELLNKSDVEKNNEKTLSPNYIEIQFESFFNLHYHFLTYILKFLKEDKNDPALDKIKFNLKLGELGVITSLFYDADILDEKNFSKTDLNDVFSKYCVTIGKTQPKKAKSSLIKKINYKDEKAVSSVLELLKKMQKILEENNTFN